MPVASSPDTVTWISTSSQMWLGKNMTKKYRDYSKVALWWGKCFCIYRKGLVTDEWHVKSFYIFMFPSFSLLVFPFLHMHTHKCSLESNEHSFFFLSWTTCDDLLVQDPLFWNTPVKYLCRLISGKKSILSIKLTNFFITKLNCCQQNTIIIINHMISN